MKKIPMFILAACAFTGAFAQQQTLVSGKLISGGSGGPTIKFAQIFDQTAVFTGGSGAWVVNHSFTLGGGGFGLVNKVKVREWNADTSLYLNMGYGGAKIGYIYAPNNVMHVSGNALIGAGGVNVVKRGTSGFTDNNVNRAYQADDAFFILEPSVQAELNVLPYLRIGAGVGYRYVSDLNNEYVTDEDLRGPSASINLMFGRF